MNKEQIKKTTALGVVVFYIVSLLVVAAVVFTVFALNAVLVLKTGLPESSLKVGNLVGSGLGVAIGSAVFTGWGRVKGIWSAVSVGSAVIAVKMIAKAVLPAQSVFTWGTLVGVLYVLVVVLAGASLGAALTRR